MISRMGASVNTAMGLSHLVAEDRAGLQKAVVDIATEPGRVGLEKKKVQQARIQRGWVAPKSAESCTALLKGFFGSLGEVRKL